MNAAEAVGPGRVLQGDNIAAWLSDPDHFPVMVAHPSLPPAAFEKARHGLGMPVGCALVLDPNCPPHQAFSIAAPPELTEAAP